jgi:hypothetical protein
VSVPDEVVLSRTRAEEVRALRSAAVVRVAGCVGFIGVLTNIIG